MEVARSDHAIVLRAWQPAFARPVGVRLLPRTTIETLEADFRLAGALAGHPNVVTVHGFGTTGDGVPYVVTELLERGSLADRVARDGPLDWYEAVGATVKVAGVLMAAAEAGVGGPAVTADDVMLSRFGEPKMAVVNGLPAPGGDQVAALRSLLRALLAGDVPDALQPALDSQATDVADLVRQLQRAQVAAGRPVTELPRASVAAAPTPATGPAGFSEAVTVAPTLPPPRGGRRWALIAAGLVVALLTAALLLRTDDRRPTATVGAGTVPATPSPTTTQPVPVGEPIDPPLRTTDFNPSARMTVLREGDSFERGALQLRIAAGTGRTFYSTFGLRGEHRLSLSLSAAGMTAAPSFRLGLVCGSLAAGDKHFHGSVSATGAWEIEANGQTVASGSAPDRQAELRDAFVLRLDCLTDRSPTGATLILNGTALGRADGPEPFPIPGAMLSATAREPQDLEVEIRSFSMHRLR